MRGSSGANGGKPGILERLARDDPEGNRIGLVKGQVLGGGPLIENGAPSETPDYGPTRRKKTLAGSEACGWEKNAANSNPSVPRPS